MSDEPYPSRWFKTGDYVFREGEHANRAYLIKSGVVGVLKKIGNGEETIATHRKGAIFGEMALIDNKPRSASVMCKEPTELVIIDRNDLEKRFGKTDPVVLRLITTLTQRLRDQSDDLASLRAEATKLDTSGTKKS